MKKHWIGVASLDHVKIGMQQGFCQVCHGKKAPLNRMKAGDYLFYYAPKKSFAGKEQCQQFVAVGEIVSLGDAYQIEMYPNFFPFRKDVHYIKPINNVTLGVVQQHPEWRRYQSRLRFGHFELSEAFGEWLLAQMTNG